MNNYGRIQIFTPYKEVTDTNVQEILKEAYTFFQVNCGDIKYLYDYYRGNQPILYRHKTIRPEINNKIVENHAYEIVNFRTGY